MKRRSLLFGGAALIVAPAIVRASTLMPVSVLNPWTINPPDFWMRPHLGLEIEQWQAGYWAPFPKGKHDDTLPSYEPVPEKDVPSDIIRSPKDIYIVRPQPGYRDMEAADHVALIGVR